MKWILLSIFCLNYICVSAQLNDDFSDSNFTQNPVWSGTQNLFIVNAAKQLQLNSTSAGEAYLATPNTKLQNTEWNFYVRLAFSPSAGNFARVYLVSDKNTLNGAVNGYYIQLGEAGSADGIDLFRQDSVTHTKIIDGKAGTIAKTNNTVRIKVTRDDLGNWTLYSDTLGTTNYHLEGNAFDNTFISTKYFGIYAKYTATNASKIYFDDVSVTQTKTDTIPPKLISAELISTTQLQLTFNEALDQNSAAITTNYTINNAVGNPVSANLVNGSPNKVLLTFTKAFSGNTTYEITANNIADLEGNTIKTPQTIDFSYFEAHKLDIVINEIMADPSPPVTLPDSEYIELYNTTKQAISLKNWTLSDGSTTTTFGNDSLAANSYAIVIATANVSLFASYGKIISVPNLPSLNNTSDQLILRNANGKLIDQVNYDLSWYKNASKESGGYSLEKINPTDSCHGSDNWIASNDLSGGTPGTQNSVYSIIPDTTAPKLISLKILDSTTLQLEFDEALDSNTSLLSNFTLNNGSILQSIHIYPGRKMLQLSFDKAFISRQKINLTISGLQDCAGNKVTNLQTNFIYYKPEKADRFDIIISEIMANPNGNLALPNTEYIQLYNRSTKIISLKNFKYSDANTSVLLPDYLLLPDSFVVLCPENSVASLLPFCKNIIGLKTWPNLNNSSDSLYIRSANGELIYFVNYTDKMHSDELKKSGGWSLELIDKNLPCAFQNNYTSSKNKNGGTPGKQNSVNGKLQNFGAPEATNIQIIDSQTIVIQFDKAVDSLSTTDTKHFSIDPYIEIAKNALVLPPDFSRVQIHLNQPLEKNKLYSLTIKEINNCSGKTLEEKILQFGLPLLPDSFDVVINEILFNPNTGGSDFMEIYNRSDKILDLKDLLIANLDENNKLQNIKPVSNKSRLFLPKEYIVVTEDAENINANYQVPSPEKIIELSSLPSLPDDEGSFVILRKDGSRIDEVHYSEDWHFPLISIKDGVSLEKINPNLPSNISSSWHSAASTVGYATPTYQNSQFQSSTQNKNNQAFTFDPPVFSPDGDGYQDVLNINYKLPENGNVAKLEIYDIQGRLIKQISNNQLLGTAGYLQWNGLTDAGNKAPIGVYILLISTFNTKGETEVCKLSCTLAGRI